VYAIGQHISAIVMTWALMLTGNSSKVFCFLLFLQALQSPGEVYGIYETVTVQPEFYQPLSEGILNTEVLGMRLRSVIMPNFSQAIATLRRKRKCKIRVRSPFYFTFCPRKSLQVASNTNADISYLNFTEKPIPPRL
jgi:hypothetical protein